MARIPRDADPQTNGKDEHVTVLRTGSPEEVKPEDILGDSVIKGDATERNLAKVPEQRKVRRFEVIKGGPYSAPGVGTAGGYRALLREGKIIDEMNYDIRAVQAQGIKLNELTE